MSRKPHDHRTQPTLSAVVRYWHGIRGSRVMPRRSDLNPRDIKDLLPDIQLIEVHPGPRFRYRLLGTNITRVFGRDFTGQFVDETVSGDRLNFAVENYLDILARKKPMFARNAYRTIEDHEFVTNRVYLPLSDDDCEINMLLCGVTFQSLSAIPGLWKILGMWHSAQMMRALDVKEEISLSDISDCTLAPRMGVTRTWSTLDNR